MPHFKKIKTVLFIAIFYFVFSEVVLSPFYPQFFEKVFGIEELEYTAFYIFVARLTVVIALPVWGLLAKHFEVKHLLYVGQWISVVMLIGMAMSQSVQQFIVFTILLLIGKSSFFLIYPLLIELSEKNRKSEIAGMYHATFHGAVILGTLSGTWFLQLKNPLLLFYGLAGFDLILWLFCSLVLKKVPSKRQTTVEHNSPGHSGRTQLRFLVTIGLVIFTFHTANNMIRPYFTTYTMNDFQLSLIKSSVLFMIPSVMAIIAYPSIRKVCVPQKLNVIFLLTILIVAASLLLQGMTSSLVVLYIGRIVYGFFFAVAQAALEVFLFNQSEKQLHVNYTIASSFQNAGLLAAPLAASTAVVSYSLSAPLVLAGGICLISLILAKVTIFRNVQRPSMVNVSE